MRAIFIQFGPVHAALQRQPQSARALPCPACVCDAEYGSMRRRFWGFKINGGKGVYMADIQGQQMQGAPGTDAIHSCSVSAPLHPVPLQRKLTEIDATLLN